jgi:hypothetical protein
MLNSSAWQYAAMHLLPYSALQLFPVPQPASLAVSGVGPVTVRHIVLPLQRFQEPLLLTSLVIKSTRTCQLLQYNHVQLKQDHLHHQQKQQQQQHLARQQRRRQERQQRRQQQRQPPQQQSTASRALLGTQAFTESGAKLPVISLKWCAALQHELLHCTGCNETAR